MAGPQWLCGFMFLYAQNSSDMLYTTNIIIALPKMRKVVHSRRQVAGDSHRLRVRWWSDGFGSGRAVPDASRNPDIIRQKRIFGRSKSML